MTGAEDGRPSAAPGLADLARRVVATLTGQRGTVAAAESLTGGLVVAALTEVPGASAAVRGGVVAYAADVKRDVLGVPQQVLDRHGTVSPECAAAMAEGVRSLLGAAWGVATTGVAGPEPSEGHPVGTVHVAVAGEHGTVRAALHLQGSRAEVRTATVLSVLTLLEESAAGLSVPDGTVGVPHTAERPAHDTVNDGG